MFQVFLQVARFCREGEGVSFPLQLPGLGRSWQDVGHGLHARDPEDGGERGHAQEGSGGQSADPDVLCYLPRYPTMPVLCLPCSCLVPSSIPVDWFSLPPQMRCRSLLKSSCQMIISSSLLVWLEGLAVMWSRSLFICHLCAWVCSWALHREWEC